MDSDTLRIVVIAVLGAGAALWLLSTFVFSFAGTWERVLSNDDIEEGARPERITLGQLGPFVTGRRDVKGGYQEYSGLAVGRSVTLLRRDHGIKQLLALGYPDAVAAKRDGEVSARLKVVLVDGGTAMAGTFEPYKVEYTHQPPRVTAVNIQRAQRRRYRRVEAVAAGERVPGIRDDVEVTEA